jgi:GPH family glycoside/pentoside/hexuronide:cation symporter
LIATFVTPLKNMLGAGDEATGFQLTMMLFAVISISLFWITFATTKERVHPKNEPSDIRSDLRMLIGIGPWVALFFSGVFALMNIAVRLGSTLFYFKYYIGDDGTRIFWIFDKTAVFLSLSTFSMLAGITLTQFLVRRFEKRSLMIALTLGNAVAMAVLFVIPPDQYWLIVALAVIGGLLSGPTPALVWSMYADCADYGEWKTGRRITALIFSASQFAQKFGLAIGAGLSGYILSLFGFVANEVQSETSMTGIRLMFSVFPAILATLSALAILFYRLDSAKVKQIEMDLWERHSQQASGPESTRL